MQGRLRQADKQKEKVAKENRQKWQKLTGQPPPVSRH
jgi:hypothetical protein